MIYNKHILKQKVGLGGWVKNNIYIYMQTGEIASHIEAQAGLGVEAFCPAPPHTFWRNFFSQKQI